MRTEKKFDCLAYKRKIQAEIYEQIKGLTPREQIDYFKRAAETGPLGQWWKKVKGASRPGATA